jgi:hypothetical protein
MDFVHDQLASGRKLRVLTAIDKWHRQYVALLADFALTGRSFSNYFRKANCPSCRVRPAEYVFPRWVSLEVTASFTQRSTGSGI